MKLSAVAVLLAAAPASASFFTNNTNAQQNMWSTFKTEYGKQYSTVKEDAKRFAIFIENMRIVDERNAAELANGGEAVHGITKFADLSQDEFKAQYLTSQPPAQKSTDRIELPAPKSDSGLVDWTNVYTTPVKDQGYCGSCWAFSATEQIESDYMRQEGGYEILSPEQIVQCDSTSYGCSGGWTEHAYRYVKTAGGLDTEEDYPYTSYSGLTGTCSSSTPVVSISGYSTISGESSMASYVQSTGPLSVCLDASSWSSYSSGILSVCGTSVDHCVQAVGVDASSGGYWKVRNSWGTSWGESGFIRLAYGSNTCDITNDPTYVSIA